MFWLTRTEKKLTHLDADELMHLLCPALLPAGAERSWSHQFRINEGDIAFAGTWDQHSFKLRRVIEIAGVMDGNRAFVPIINGTISRHSTGRTELTMHYAFHPVGQWGFTLMLCLGFAVLIIQPMTGWFVNEVPLSAVGLSLVFLVVMTTVQFNREINMWQTFLEERLKKSPYA